MDYRGRLQQIVNEGVLDGMRPLAIGQCLHHGCSYHGLLRLLLRITDPCAPPLPPTFTVSVLSMSFTGVLTYWLVVGLYQSIHFYQAAMERQTRAAQLETQLSHAELENLKSQLHPHFLFNSLHTIGILMQENVDAASHLLVCLGDLLRMRRTLFHCTITLTD